VGYVANQLNLDVDPVRLLVFAALVLCGVLVFASVKLTLAALAFWTTTSLQMMVAVYEVSDTSRYPLDVFPTPVRMLLTSVLPFAFTGFVPADYLLHGVSRIVWFAPVMAVLITAVGLRVWALGVERFEAVGS
jgi:ABC-2 type transport system permease protein